jgi:hypothetical protein
MQRHIMMSAHSLIQKRRSMYEMIKQQRQEFYARHSTTTTTTTTATTTTKMKSELHQAAPKHPTQKPLCQRAS